MPGINGMGLTFNLPNFNGALYPLTPADTPFTSAIGVMSNGGEPVYAKDFEWQTYDLRTVENPSHLEGQNAPTARERVRTSVDNVVQIFHSQVSVSYTKQAAAAQRNGLNNSQPTAQANEMNWQLLQELKSLKRDIEHVLLNGAFSKPADNAAPRKTRGLLPAITTNVVDSTGSAQSFTATASTDNVTLNAHGFVSGTPVVIDSVTGGAGLGPAGATHYVRDVSTNTFKLAAAPGGGAIDIITDATAGSLRAHQPLVSARVIDLMQGVWDNGGIQESGTATIMVNSGVKRQLTKAFVTDKGYEEKTRDVGGVNLQTIETDFGRLNIMLNRYMPTDQLAVTSLEVCKPRVLLIPSKGFLFLEPLAKTGASDQAQLYGEIGLEYGNERQHGKITGLNPAAQS